MTATGRENMPLVRSTMEAQMPLQTRSIPRQIIYLTLAFAALAAVLAALSRYHL
jgi:hypothetical protein